MPKNKFLISHPKTRSLTNSIDAMLPGGACDRFRERSVIIENNSDLTV
jgi:hypothetical protein